MKSCHVVDSNGKSAKDRKLRKETSSKSDQQKASEREIPGNAERRIRLDPRVISLVNSIIEKNVPRRVQKHAFFSNLDGDNQKMATDEEEKCRSVISKDDAISSESEQEKIETQVSLRQHSRKSINRSAERKGDDDDEDDDLRESTEPKRPIEDLRNRLSRKIENGNEKIVLNGTGRSCSKRFRAAAESDSPALIDDSPSTPPRTRSEIGIVRRASKRKSTSESESESSDDQRRRRKIASRKSPNTDRRPIRLQKRSFKSDDERPDSSKSPGSESEERFTFFFTKKYPFSNHYPCQFTIDGNTFNCTEQYYMYKKAEHFRDHATAELILAATVPSKIKALGKSSNIRGFREDEWDREDVGRRYMYEANRAKYQQNAYLKDRLLDTQGTTLVEANPSDLKWGIGLSMDSPLRKSRRSWRGKNWLGEILTRIRDEMMEDERR